jgi:hypothetical protein
MSRTTLLSVFCLCVLACCGCNGPRARTDFDFGPGGWGGADLEFSRNPADGSLAIKSGMLVNRDFRWADSQFSLDFKDKPDLVWGFRLLDDTFRDMRRRDLLQSRTVIKTGPDKFYTGSNLPASEIWRLWPYDRVLDVAFVRDKDGRGYKVFGGWWQERILGEGLAAVKVEGAHDVRLKRNSWNRLTVTIQNGKITYKLNGKPGKGGFQVDPRANGRLGIAVHQGGPLVIRNLNLGGGEADGP